ncbi:MAG TPA: alpha-glucosidase [Spirochaetota bacterium]|nr:alpha-glucosidase [Spirochaetota bacterium]
MKKVWWKHGVIYQIYPRSFKDSNHDGIGDINGITECLDYLQDLGIDGIWLSPIYRSPMYDFGYDVSDYCDIDPVFGTMRDFKHLVKEAEKRNIAIIMDMVFNHTSHLHPWFLESRSSKDNPKRDWYIWHPGKKRKVPNNWMAAFGGRAWEWDPLTQEYYLHLFTKQQPDLNWRNPNVKKAMFDVLRFWMDNGVKGFRFDVINYIMKDPLFRNNPYKFRLTYPRRHDLQYHLYDRNQPEIHDILKELRHLLDSYGQIMSVGETYPNEGEREPLMAASYLGNNDELHLSFDFSTIYISFSAKEFTSILIQWYNAIGNKGWPSHVLSNHDQSRAITRIAKNDLQKAKLLAVLLLTQKGTPFIYYGEEIGMVDGKIPYRYIQDPVGKKYWPFHTGRDKARTPMQWDATSYAGFSTAKPWLPVNPDYTRTNVALQSKNAESMMQFYRQLIALRKSRKELYAGEIEFLPGSDDVMLYKRVWNNDTCLVALNFSSSKRKINFDSTCRVLLSSYQKNIIDVQTITLDPFEAVICSK